MRYNLCWSQPLVLGVNKKHPLAKKKEVSLAELKRQEILSYDPASPVYQEIVDLIEGYDLNVQFSYDDEITLSVVGCWQRIENRSVLLLVDDQRVRRCGVYSCA